MPRRRSTRIAELRTWDPARRLERLVKRRTLPFSGSIAALVADADRLVPRFRMSRVWASLFSPLHLTLEYGCDRRGVSLSLRLQLHASDVPLLLSYALHGQFTVAGVLFLDLPDEDDDGGLTVPRPAMTRDALAALPVPAPLQ